MHERPSAPTTLQRDPWSLSLEKYFSLRSSSSYWFFFDLIFFFVIATLEIFLPNHTWNIIISSEPCFVIIKTEINQTLVSHTLLVGKTMLTVDEVSTTLLETENINQPSSLSHTWQTLVMNFEPHYGRSKSWGRNHDRRDDRS